MPKRMNLPDAASVAASLGDGRLHAPSAARNLGAITDVLRAHGPKSGSALEIASGTGQHIVGFAGALPGVIWHPSDVDAARRASVDAWAREAGLRNLRPARDLDATTSGWGAGAGPQDLIYLGNLLHLISTPEARTLINEVVAALAPEGCFILYGPFLRNGATTSEGDAAFDASIRAADPELGYKNDRDLSAWLVQAGLARIQRVDMPANNLCFIARR